MMAKNGEAYEAWFSRATGHAQPWPWQAALGQAEDCRDRLLRVPTGFGKTEGVLAAWLYHHVGPDRPNWPRRLVWCLPMRVLVEQTLSVAQAMVERLSLGKEVNVAPLMGGEDAGQWYLEPEQPTILIGTQDMLLSRALNRGYGSGRAHWPMDYGLLNRDCLWVFDEIQLMGVGLATGVQLQAFRQWFDGRAEAAGVANGPTTCTWWMSATLQPDWLDSPDLDEAALRTLREDMLEVPGQQLRSVPAGGAAKPVELIEVDEDEHDELAEIVQQAHAESEAGESGRVTLVVANTVDRAVKLHDVLKRRLGKDSAAELRLVHSRFRGLERERWVENFLSKDCCSSGADRIIVATQVVEAGVDMSATALITELAPWPSLVQRFGRAGRYGEAARVIVVDRGVKENSALPYDAAQLEAARQAIDTLDDVGIESLERYERDLRAQDPQQLAALYPYEPLHRLTQRECRELFDTSADLTGADLDISRFIREGDARDVQVFWADVEAKGAPDAEMQPTPKGLCPVPVAETERWLVKGKRRAWVWDYLDNAWAKVHGTEALRPGVTVLVAADEGGYDADEQRPLGYRGAKQKGAVPTDGGVRDAHREPRPEIDADRGEGREDLTCGEWKTIFTHGREAAAKARELARSLALPPEIAELLELGARLHDWGKAHPAFQAELRKVKPTPNRNDLAKSPGGGRRGSWAYGDDATGRRRGFRHELATVLAMFDLLERHDADHAALLGPYRELVELGVLEVVRSSETDDAAGAIVTELAQLSAERFDLLTYLVASHHGKVRGSWHSTPGDQAFPLAEDGLMGEGMPLRGVREGDELPSIVLPDAEGEPVAAPAVALHLDPAAVGLSRRYGASWSERVGRLVDAYGPFGLAWLETLLRVADVRASRLTTEDSELEALPAEEGAPS